MKTTLVLQAPQLSPAAVDRLATLAAAREREDVDAGLTRLHGADPASRAAVADAAAALRVDVAWVERERRFADFGLVVSDMDSTLITIECIDEIAAMQGIKDQVAAITARAMQGELDFAQSLRERVALLAGLPERALEDVWRQRLQLSPGARELVAACQENGVRFMLVSGGFTFFTDRLQAELGLDWAYANRLEVVNGHLTGRVDSDIVDAEAKRRLLMDKRQQLGLDADRVIAIGDGANDLPMLAEAGVGIATHAKPRVRAAADVAIDHCGLDAVYRMFR